MSLTNYQLNDPDFDEPQVTSKHLESSSLFDVINPKTALTIGLIGGFLVLGTIGFFVLLVLVLTR